MSKAARNGSAIEEPSAEGLRLRASELSYRRLFETAQDGILILDFDSGRICDANPFLVKLLGFPLDEILGKTVADLSPGKDIVSNQAMLEKLKLDRYVRYEDLPLETRDGRRIAVEFVSNVYQAGDKEVIQCNIRDITVRRQMEQRLGLLDACIAHLNDIVLVTESEPLDEPGPRIVFVNQAFERLTGYTSDEVLGRSPRILQGAKTDRRILDEIRAALAQQKPIRRQILNYAKDGSEYWLDVDIVPIHSRTGKCTHFAAIERDITAEKKAESQLLWRTALFEAQVNSSPDGILVVDSEMKIIIQNQQVISLWNPPDDVRDTTDHRQRLQWMTNQVKNSPAFAEKVAYLYAHPCEITHDEIALINGKIFDRYTAPVLGRDGTYFGRIWTYRDITERKKTETRFRRLVESNAQGVVFWNTQGEITQANDAFLKIVGYTRQDLAAGKINWIALTPRSTPTWTGVAWRKSPPPVPARRTKRNIFGRTIRACLSCSAPRHLRTTPAKASASTSISRIAKNSNSSICACSAWRA
jgi:PAS domain S-box-containing protein